MRFAAVRRCALACAAVSFFFSLAPAWSQTTGQPDAPLNATPAAWFIYGVIIAILLGSFIALFIVRASVAGSSWSLADALSEETEVTQMVPRPTGASPADDRTPMFDASGKPITVSEMRASSSRLIALMGSLVILLMFLGFGSFALYRFAVTGEMPKGIDDVIHFLLAGLTLFAPYVVNKFSSLFESLSPRR